MKHAMQHNYAFIDSQNLNLSIRAQGWKLDFTKFRVYLKDKYQVEKAFLFLGYVAHHTPLYQSLRDAGYKLIFKPTLQLKNGVVKGNVDAELVLHTMIQYPHFDKAIIVSNDGDFYCLIEYLVKHRKLLHVLIPNRRAYSSLLKPFRDYMHFMNDLTPKLADKKFR